MQLTTKLERRAPLVRGGAADHNAPKQIMRNFIRFAGILACALLIALGGPLEARAQNSSTTGQIRGRVLNETGQAVSGVVVTARNVNTGLTRSALTSEDGLYTIRLLPPGTYRVRTDVIGFEEEEVESVRVVVGNSTPVNFGLEEAAVDVEGIEVTAEREPIDVSDGGVTQFVSQEEIEGLPSISRDFVDFINLSGLVAPDPGETTGGQFSIAGQRASQTSIQIDGVDANNSFFGENRGGSRIPFVFSLESIREFQIITNGFDVEHGKFSGGIINVITRGGGNEFEGSVYANLRDDALTAQPFIDDPNDPELTTDYEVQRFSGRVSGPIVRDKAHFALSLEAQRRREPQLPLTRGRFAPGASNADSVVYEQIGEFFDILESQYGVEDPEEGYRPFETTNDALTLFGRVDWNLNENNRLSFRHNFSTYENDNEWNGNFDFEYGISRAEKLEDRSHSFVTELQSVLGPNTFNIFRFQFSDEKRPRQGKELRPTLTVNLDGGQRIRYGGTFASFNNNLEETKYQVVNNFTHVLGDHSLKVGGNLLYTNYFNRFQNFGSQFQGAGEFRFSDLDAFESFRPSSYFRPIQEGGGIPTSEFDVLEAAFYMQDEWQVTPKLSATLGLRYDLQSFRDSPTPVVDVERAFDWETGFAPTDENNVAPRLALAYDLHGDGSAVVRAGAGLFYGTVPGVVGGNVLQTERPVLEVICNGSIAEGDPDAPPRPTGYSDWDTDGFDNPTSCQDVGAAGVPTYTFWQPDFEYPKTFKANLGYETLLGPNSQVSVDLLFSQSSSLYTVRNLNLRNRQFQLDGEDGRRIYSPAGQFDPTGGNSTAARRNLEFGDVLVNFNDGKARSFVASVEGSHRFSENIQLRGSYTFTKAWDNSPYSCCTAGGGYAGTEIGVFGPNEIGDFGDDDRAWGISDFSRDHALVLSGFADLPWGIELAAFWKSQSGRPWSVVGDGDLNGDGVRFNDRIFVFSPENVPLAATGEDATAERETYRNLLNEFDCVSDHQGEVIPRNSCRFPWTHQLDMRVTKSFDTFRGQRAELQLDLFNVLNGVGRLLCDEGTDDFDPTSGVCGLGRVTGVFGANTNLLEVEGFDPADGEIQYSVNDRFGQEDLLGSNLILQFQAQIGFRYYF